MVEFEVARPDSLGATRMVVRYRLDAAWYEPAAPRRPHQQGRTPRKGKRLPTLERALKDRKTVLKKVTVGHWYGERKRVVEITSGTAVWYHPGMPIVPYRWVLIRDPKGKFEPHALLCTDLTVKPEQILKMRCVTRSNALNLDKVQLRAQSQRKPLGITEDNLLRKTYKAVCDEWAASDGVINQTALHEIESWLQRIDHDSVPARSIRDSSF